MAGRSFRCSATGRARPDTLQLTIAPGTVLAPGDRYVIGGAGFTGAGDGHGPTTWPTQLADVEFGVLIRTAAGELVDRVAVSAYGDSACQADGAKLRAFSTPSRGSRGSAPTTAGSSSRRAPPARATRRPRSSVFHEEFAYPDPIGVAISELADDPSPEALPAGSEQRNYIEVANYGSAAVDVSGWTVRRCEASGIRSRDLQFTVPDGTCSSRARSFLAARSGTPTADLADITYDTTLNFLGTGVWLEDAAGNRIDSIGVYAQNEMDASNVIDSPCTKGTALTTYQPDRMLSETFQRAQFSGVDADDFVVAEATPGVIDLLGWVDPTVRAAAIEPAAVLLDRTRVHAELRRTAQNATAPATVVETFSGVSAVPLESLVGSHETSGATDAADRRIRAPVPADRARRRDARGGLRRRVERTHRRPQRAAVLGVGWRSWRLLDAAAGDPDDGGRVILTGSLLAADITDGVVTLLVQDGPRTEPTLATALDGTLASRPAMTSRSPTSPIRSTSPRATPRSTRSWSAGSPTRPLTARSRS